jgi:Ca2+-binding RTX toxin-like protein
VGGADVDVLTGGSGNDTFRFLNPADSIPGSFDTIADFAVGSEKLDLSAIDANTSSGADDAFLFVAVQTTDVVANSVTWSQSGGNTLIRADLDGDAVADFAITLTGSKTLTASDFLL